MQAPAYANMVQSLFKTKDFNVAADGMVHAAVAELRSQHARIAELEEQLSAIGAGGVEPLRKSAAADAPVVPQGWKPVQIELLERIQESLGSFISDQGWSQSDMDTADVLGELLDAVKKVCAYDKPIDLENAIEVLGDLEFYMEALRQQIGVSREQVLRANQDKLAKRYPSFRYSDSLAQQRLDKESTVGRDNFQP